MSKKRVLISGACGFVGSHVVEHLLANTDWDIVGITTFRHKGDSLRTESFDPARVDLIFHDLAGPISERLAARIGPIDYVLNLASDSHVDRSIIDPVPFIRNNVEVVLNVLEYCRQAKPAAVIQMLTDEIFGPAPANYQHKEWDIYLPSNPYSASKAAQGAIAISYWRTYGLPISLVQCMNIIGERQDKEKFVPMVISKVQKGETVTIHGDPEKGLVGSRYYLHARNLADAMLFILKNQPPTLYPNGDRPNSYNIVGEKEVDNLAMAQMIARFVGKELKYEIVNFHKSRPGHDLRYALDGSKMASLGWKAPVPLEESLRRTVEWTLLKPEWLL